MDESKIKEAVRLLLEGIGEDPNREGLQDTPDRVARMCAEIFGGLGKTADEHLEKTFSCTRGEMVIEKDIPFHSVCEHHLLPFFGKAHIAYVPDGKVVGISKLARTVEVFARRPQIQEQLTAQVCDSIMNNLHPKGVMVVMEAEHMCMTMRGVRKPGTQTVTFATAGCFADNEALQDQFLRMVK